MFASACKKKRLPQEKRVFAVCHHTLGEICKARNDLTEAEAYDLKSLAILEELAANAASEDLVEAYQYLAGEYEAKGDLKSAKNTHKAEKIRGNR